MRKMKTYLFQHLLTAVLPKRQHMKRILTSALAMSASIILLANAAPYNSSLSDTSRVSTAGTDQIAKLPIQPTNLVAGSVTNDEFSLPLVMSAFKAILTDNKVTLSWTTGIEKRISHFVVERSTDGIEYKEAALVFAVTNSSVKQNYSFTDVVSIYSKGVLYYRIKIVDANGRFQNSAGKLIRVGDAANVTKVETYPNPVVHEVRITIPSSWQNQTVRYEIYNYSGRLVKGMTSSNANQTEVMNLDECIAGLYIIKAYTRSET